MSTTEGRSYYSPLRAEQAEQTRTRIVEAAVDLLAEGDVADLSMPDVADRAGVSVRTAYRSFPSREELLDGVLGWLESRMEERAGPRPSTRAEYEMSAPGSIGAVFDNESLYRALFATRAGRDSHQRRVGGRQDDIARAFAAELEGLDEGAARRVGALLHLVSSSNSALFIKDYWGLSPEDIGQAMRWAIAVLADAASDPARRGDL